MSFDADVKKSLPYQEMFAKDIEQYWDSELRQDVRTIRHKGGDYNPIDYMVIKKKTNRIMVYIKLKKMLMENLYYKRKLVLHTLMDYKLINVLTILKIKSLKIPVL